MFAGSSELSDLEPSDEEKEQYREAGVDREAKKRELYAILAYLSEYAHEHVRDQRTKRAGELGIGVTTKDSQNMLHYRPATKADLGPTMFQEIGDDSRFSSQDYFGAISTLRFNTDGSENSMFFWDFADVLRSPELLPKARRAWDLMREYDSALFAKISEAVKKRFSEDTSDDAVCFGISIEMQAGFNSGTDRMSSLLRVLPKVVAPKNPQLTCDDILEIARKNSGLVRGPAGLNDKQMVAAFEALQIPAGRFHEWIKENRPRMKEFDPAHFEFDEQTDSLSYSQPLVELLARIFEEEDKEHKNPIIGPVKDLVKDGAGIESREGCPARLEVATGKLSAITREWLNHIELAEPYWRLTLPTRKPMLLNEGKDFSCDRVELDNLPGVRVRILPSASGRVSLEASDDELAKHLDIRIEDGRLAIATGADADSIAGLELTLRVPTRVDLNARNVTDLEAEFVHTAKVEVPEGGRLRADLPQAKHRVVAGDESDVLLLVHHATDVELSNGSHTQEPEALLISKWDFPSELDNGGEHIALLALTPEKFDDLDAGRRQRLAENSDFLARHWVAHLTHGHDLYERLTAYGAPAHQGNIAKSATPQAVAPGPAVKPRGAGGPGM